MLSIQAVLWICMSKAEQVRLVSRMNTPAHPAFPMALPDSTNNTSYKIPPYITITLHWALC